MENMTRKRWRDRRAERNKSKQRSYIKNKWAENIFLIIDSGSTEQQVLHIEHVKIHQKENRQQCCNNVHKHLWRSVKLWDRRETSSRAQLEVFTVRQQNTKPKKQKKEEEKFHKRKIRVMKNTNLTRYKKVDISEWIVSTHLTQDKFTPNTPAVCLWKQTKKRGKPAKKKGNKTSKQNNKKKARFGREKTAISNMLSIGNRRRKEIKRRIRIQIKRNVYSIKAADRIEFDRREVFPVTFPRKIQPMKRDSDRLGAFFKRERDWVWGRRDLQFSAFFCFY